jgi:hypothetical protein
MYGGASTAVRRAAVEALITPARVVQLFDDDQDGVVDGADLVKLEGMMADADDIVTGLLLKKGFTLETLEVLALDRQVVRAWASITAQLAAERRTEWLDEQGRGPYDVMGTRARAELGALARGDIRSVKEGDGSMPANTSLSGDVARGDFIFSDPCDPTGRGPGGF